jgi:hypothetical protein
MTYSNGVDGTVPELKLRVEEDSDNGDYLKLRGGSNEEDEGSSAESSRCPIGSVTSVWFWVKLISLVVCLGSLAFVIIKWVGPFLIEKVRFFFVSRRSDAYWLHLIGLGYA